jgi:flagellar biosynthesis/type III secretory pathway chaperone
MAHPLDDVDDMIDDLARLEDVMLTEIDMIHACDFSALDQLQYEKQALVPVLQRANSVVHAVLAEGITIEDDPDLYDLALALIQLSKVAEENQRVVGAALKATQVTIRTMVNALRSDTSVPNPRYSRTGNPVIAGARRSAGLAHGSL